MVTTVKASPSEQRSGRLTDQNLETAVRCLHIDGLVVIENVIPHSLLDTLNHKMTEDARYLASLGEDSPFNYNRGNLQQDAPPVKEFFEPSIFFNPIATQITSSVLGPRPKMTFLSGNTAMPPTKDMTPQRQPVHSDADFAHPDHPFALVVNVPLVSMRPENGSTEIWLGTHSKYGQEAQEGAHGDRASGRIQTNILEARRAISPPEQPVIPKGSIIIRDLRLWHAGMPNESQEIRVMLAMIHFACWYRNPMRLELGEGIEGMVKEAAVKGLEVRADYVPEEKVLETYLRRGFGNSYDFGQTV